MMPVDVIVPVCLHPDQTIVCLKAVLTSSGPRLGRLWVVDDASPEPRMKDALRTLAAADDRVSVLTNAQNLGFVESCNRGLRERTGDVVVLNSDILVTNGWLDELWAVANSDERTACVSPLTNHGTINSVPRFNAETPASDVSVEVVGRAVAGLPRSTITPVAHGFCLYFRGAVLDIIGGFDPIFSPGYNEDNDWSMRAQALGFVARRANHAMVYLLRGGQPVGGEDVTQAAQLDAAHSATLHQRYPHYLAQVRRFCASLDSRLAAHAVHVESTGRMRVALDLRHLNAVVDGTHRYGLQLANALANSDQIDLTLIVTPDLTLPPLRARVLSAPQSLEDVDVIHKPAQVFDPGALALFAASPAHLVISHLDLIAHHAEAVFRDAEQAEIYRSVSYAALQSAQGIIALSRSAQLDIASNYGVPEDSISVVPYGFEFEAPEGRRSANDEMLGFDLPERIFLCVGTDFPHKNHAFLLEAYQRLRERCREGEPPALLLVGPTCALPGTAYKTLRQTAPAGVRYLGEVSEYTLRSLYQRAIALVFASVYEGFGFPPLEAMAVGTPVVALPQPPITDVCGDAALYPVTFAIDEFADCLERIAASPSLRQQYASAALAQVRRYTTANMVDLTLKAYRRAIFEPQDRSLVARRYLLANAEARAATRQARELRPRVESLEGELRHYRSLLDEVNRSISFRIGMKMTAPMRWITRYASRASREDA
jgi:glycosyltransferase involved in cell wall biosynthesis